MDSVPCAVCIAKQQHVNPCHVAKAEATPPCDIFDPLKIFAPDHEIHVPGQGRVLGAGFLNVDENRKAANQLIGHVFFPQRFSDSAQHTNQAE